MGLDGAIDITFDFRSETPGWPDDDPDKRSPTLRRYHQLLWSKPLPSGAPFELDVTTPGVYLHPRCELVDPHSQFGRLGLSSDALIPTFWRAPDKLLKPIFDQIPEADIEEFNRISYTIGGMLVWPGYMVEGKITINGARGFNRGIRDRFDLTLECIRRHYRDEHSPLGDTLARYADFFRLFGDFAGYVDFFHLQGLVDETTQTVRFSLPFEDFPASPVVPKTLDTYSEYRKRAIEFIESRNRRIALLSMPGH